MYNLVELTREEVEKLLLEFYNLFNNGFEFEEFLKTYLDKIGLDEIEVTQRTRDGGIDLKALKKGLDYLSDLDTVKYYVQAKLYFPKSTIPIKDVRALRGIMPSGYKGIFITTAKFSDKSIEFGGLEIERPIIFIDGIKLIESCIDNGIGFKAKPVLDKELLNSFLNTNQINKTNAQVVDIDKFRDSIRKSISANDIRARILPIPNTIYDQIPHDVDSYNVVFNGDNNKLSLKINRNRKYFAGITETYKKYKLIKDGVGYPKDSFWFIDKEKELVNIFFEIE